MGAEVNRKWFLLTRDGDMTALVTVQVPAQASEGYSDAAIREALKTVTFRPVPLEEQLGLLPFRIGDLAGFQVSRVIPPAGKAYVDRTKLRAGMAVEDGVLVRAFANVGWGWGGYFAGTPDYQHFSSNGR